MSGIVGVSHTVAPSEIDKIRKGLGAEFQQAASLISAVRKPLPDQTGDGTYLNLTSDTPEFLKKINGLIHDLPHLGMKDVDTMVEVMKKNKDGTYWDDKTYLMEKLIEVATHFPDGSEAGKKVTDGFLAQLYSDLMHPPISYLGHDYQYRSADGSFNSLVHPDLGKAGTPYARSVLPRSMQPGCLPDAGVIFDSIMARKPENRTPHPNQLSSVLFYTASIIIHDLFRTDHKEFAISNTSSYLDLSPLYGSNLTEQMQIRTGLDGRLETDCFSETRLLAFPPGVGVMLIMFNRFHQHVVEQLALINESGRFNRPKGDPPKIDKKTKEWWKSVPAAWKNYDEDLFQVGRLVTSGLYINIILVDYVRTVLNLNKTDTNWALNPRTDIKGVPLAEGNQVSAEFNLVYRWHSAISTKDEKWTEDFIKQQLGGADPNTIPMRQFLGTLVTMQAEAEALDPVDRPFAGLKRQADQTFSDDDLVKIMTESVEDIANSFGANRVPTVMRAIEILGIEQARTWSVGSLNELRKFLNLKPHEKFTDINSDPYVAAQLERLYDHPDQVELYPGVVAEEAKKAMIPGAGLSPSFTVSRAVLSDAVALVRGDRFYTVDYHPKKLSNWGYSSVASDTAIDNGCVWYKLFLTAFPHHFRPNSVYAHYPMTVPSEMKNVLKDLGKFDQYNFDKPGRLPKTAVAHSYAAVKAIATNNEAFKTTWGGSMEYLMGPSSKGFMTSKTGSADVQAQTILAKSLSSSSAWPKIVRKYFEDETLAMLREKAYKLANLNQVDIVRDIGNLVPVHFVSELFSLPVKTKEVPHGIFTEHEMYLALLAIYTSFLKDSDSINSFSIRQTSYKAVQILGELVESHVDEITAPAVLKSVIQRFAGAKPSDVSTAGTDATKALLKTQLDAKHVVWGHILSTAAGVSATTGSLFANVIEYFSTQPKELLTTLNKLSKASDDKSFDTLMHYVLEAARLSCETVVYRTVTLAFSIQNGETHLNLQPGDRVLLNFRSACRDPVAFPAPEKFDPTRPIEKYLHLGMGPHDNLGFQTSAAALTAMCKVVLGLDALSPAAGPQGKIHKIAKLVDGKNGKVGEVEGYHGFLTENWDAVWPVPQSMKVNWI